MSYKNYFVEIFVNCMHFNPSFQYLSLNFKFLNLERNSRSSKETSWHLLWERFFSQIGLGQEYLELLIIIEKLRWCEQNSTDWPYMLRSLETFMLNQNKNCLLILKSVNEFRNSAWTVAAVSDKSRFYYFRHIVQRTEFVLAQRL